MRKASVLLVYHLYPRIALCQFVQNCPGSVHGTVVHHDDFQIAVSLLTDGADSPLNIGFYIVGGNDYGNQFRLLLLMQFGWPVLLQNFHCPFLLLCCVSVFRLSVPASLSVHFLFARQIYFYRYSLFHPDIVSIISNK